MDLISVVTAPSLRSKYLESTLLQIEREGGEDVPRLLAYDGTLPPDHTSVEAWYQRATRGWLQMNRPDGPTGVRAIMWWTFQKALDLHADRLLYMEDDLHLSRDAITRALACEVPPHCSLLSFYDYAEFPATKGRPAAGIHELPFMGNTGRGMWGNQCLLIPRRTLEFVVQREAHEWMDPWPHRRDGADTLLSWVLASHSPWPTWAVHMPCLVDHAGDESALHHTAHKASWFDSEPNTP